jgi:RNA polymerase sigma-70 factor (ECF subfamily)
MSDIDDLMLIQGFLAAPPRLATPEQVRAWEDFFSRIDPLILRTIRRADRRWDRVDDLHQETWIVLIRRLPKLRLDSAAGSLTRWALGVARRLAGWQARRQSGRQDVPVSADLLASLLDGEEGPNAACQRRDVQDRVRAVLGSAGQRMSELDRRIVVMRLIEEMTLPEIAAALGVSVDCVKMRLRRARRALEHLLRSHGFGPARSHRRSVNGRDRSCYV